MSEAIDLCKKLVRFQTDNNHLADDLGVLKAGMKLEALGSSNNVSPALEFLQAYLEGCGFQAEIVTFADKAGRKVDNLLAKIGTGHPHLLFGGHIDVVPAGDLSLWKYPPYEAADDGEYLYGRGVSDMKGGIACFAAAVKDFLAENKLRGAITLMISGDEEESVVDGTERLLEYAAARGEQYDFALVGEPSNPKELGEAIKIGRRGDVFFKIISKGTAGHTAYPQLADNPISHLVKFLADLTAEPLDQGNAFFEPSTMALTTFDVNNPASNVIPSEASAAVDVRFNSEHSGASLTDYVQKKAAAAEGDIRAEAQIYGESFLSSKDGACALLVEAVRKVTGRTPEYSTGGGTSDARFIKNYCQVVEFGLTNETIHKTNERARLSDIDKLQRIYGEFLDSYFRKD